MVFGDYGLEFFVSGDQLLRGPALNAVLVAEEMAKNGALEEAKSILVYCTQKFTFNGKLHVNVNLQASMLIYVASSHGITRSLFLQDHQ